MKTYKFSYSVRRQGSVPMKTLARIYADAAAWMERNPGYDAAVAIGKATDRLSDRVASVASFAFTEAFGAWRGDDEGATMLGFAAAIASTGDPMSNDRASTSATVHYETPTPDTDALMAGEPHGERFESMAWMDQYDKLMAHARRLEQERDAARREAFVLRCNAPSETRSGWIPVTERLPAIGENVALLISDKSVAIENWPTSGYLYPNNEWWSGVPGTYINLKGYGWTVTAWMPFAPRTETATIATPAEQEAWEGAMVSMERGWLTIRTDAGWLLWNVKVKDIPVTGLLLADIVKLARSRVKSDPHVQEDTNG